MFDVEDQTKSLRDDIRSAAIDVAALSKSDPEGALILVKEALILFAAVEGTLQLIPKPRDPEKDLTDADCDEDATDTNTRNRKLTKKKKYAVLFAVSICDRSPERSDFVQILNNTNLEYKEGSLKVLVGRLIKARHLAETERGEITLTQTGNVEMKSLRGLIGEGVATQLEAVLTENMSKFQLGW